MKKNLLWVGMLLALILTIPAMAAAAACSGHFVDVREWR